MCSSNLSWLGKRIVQRLETHHFLGLIDVLMLLAGLAMIWSALGAEHIS